MRPGVRHSAAKIHQINIAATTTMPSPSMNTGSVVETL